MKLLGGIIVLIVSLVLALGVGLLELPDSFFYAVLGQFLLTGQLSPVSPFNTIIPSTLYAPVYSYITAIFLSTPWPWGITMLPFVQLLMVFSSGYIVFYLLRQFVPRGWAIFGAVLFIVLPYNIVYAMLYMTETFDVFLLSVYLWVLYFVMNTKHPLHPGFLVFVASVATLTHNMFVFILLGSMLVWAWWEASNFFKRKRCVQRVAGGIVATIGIVGILLWMGFNFRHHGVWTLSIVRGRHLYNGVVENAHLLPPDGSPILNEFLLRAKTKETLIKPNGEAQLYFVPEFTAGTINESQIDSLFLKFSIEAIKHNIIRYATHMMKNFILVPMTHAQDEWIPLSLGIANLDCPWCGDPQLCRASWNTTICKPAVDAPWLRKLFLSYVYMQRSLYPYPMLILFALACAGAIIAIRSGGFLAVLGILFLFLHVTQLIGVTNGRYLIRLYPLYTICIVLGIRMLRKKRAQ